MPFPFVVEPECGVHAWGLQASHLVVDWSIQSGGLSGITASGAGGRRWSVLEFKEEQRVLERWAKGAQQGEVILDIFLQKPWSQKQPCPHHQRSSHENLCP